MNAPAPPPPVTAVDSTGRGLRIRFVWMGDRFGHVIERVEGDAATVELTSIESNCSAPWPDSPPVQQLSVEQIGPSTAALGVGGAGRGHWSLSALAVEHHGRPALHFDIALRCSGDIGYVGSTYARSDSSLVIEPLQKTAPTRMTEEPDSLRLMPLSVGSQTTRWAYSVSRQP